MAKKYTEEELESRRKAVRKYNENHDRINVMLPQGTNDRIKALGFTANAFAKKAVLEELERAEKYMRK